jgi:hypothetical protein
MEVAGEARPLHSSCNLSISCTDFKKFVAFQMTNPSHCFICNTKCKHITKYQIILWPVVEPGCCNVYGRAATALDISILTLWSLKKAERGVRNSGKPGNEKGSNGGVKKLQINFLKSYTTYHIISYHIISFIPFRRSLQDYKIHMDMEMIIFLQVMLYNHKSI